MIVMGVVGKNEFLVQPVDGLRGRERFSMTQLNERKLEIIFIKFSLLPKVNEKHFLVHVHSS